MSNHEQHATEPVPWWRTRSGAVFCVLAAIAAFFFVLEHRVHVLGWLPFLLVAACPLMHLFHHGGHGHGHRHDRRPEDKP